jgi:methanogenic corrinoid protein MtbC1
MAPELLSQLADSMASIEPERTLELTRAALERGLSPHTILTDGLRPGMDTVSKQYGCGAYYLPELVLAVNTMLDAIHLMEGALLASNGSNSSPGVIVIGSVQGDFHSVGKAIVAAMLRAEGFVVHDLGVDISAEKFVQAVREIQPNILALSARMTTTVLVQRQVIRELEKAGLRDSVRVLIGAVGMGESWAEQIGADACAEDAVEAVRQAHALAATPTP